MPVVIGVAGTSRQHAVELARRAEELGAACICARPPYASLSAGGSTAELEDYYGAIGRAVDIPVMIQNAGPGVLSPETLSALLQLRNIDYVKKETPQAGHVMSETLRLAGDACKGILGGGGGMHMPDEHRRGGCGTMPGAHIPEAFVAIWEALDAGDIARARELRMRVLPMSMLEVRFFPRLYKEVLVRRGVISTNVTRTLGCASLDAHAREELDAIMHEIADLMSTPAPVG